MCNREIRTTYVQRAHMNDWTNKYVRRSSCTKMKWYGVRITNKRPICGEKCVCVCIRVECIHHSSVGSRQSAVGIHPRRYCHTNYDKRTFFYSNKTLDENNKKRLSVSHHHSENASYFPNFRHPLPFRISTGRWWNTIILWAVRRDLQCAKLYSSLPIGVNGGESKYMNCIQFSLYVQRTK